MKYTLIGMGGGTDATLTAQGRLALLRADAIAGAARLLETLPEGCTPRRCAATKPAAILEALRGAERPCAVYSGDTGFFSGARSLVPLLEAEGAEAELLPGLSSIQLFAARLRRPWQDWALVSAHGVACDPVAAVCAGRPAFFLTGGAGGVASLCAELAAAGLDSLPVFAGEDLGYPQERISRGTAGEFAKKTFSPLSVLLAEAAPRQARRAPGLADGLFLRGEVPMTKQEVRAVLLGKLGVGPEMVCWDIGAGTGSVSVELALQARAVYAVEREDDACRLIRANRERFGAWNLRLVQGEAPQALASLPAPDAVFVGGTGGRLREILRAVQAAAPGACVCVSAIALETVQAALAELEALGYACEAVQIGISRARRAGQLHLLLAQNPVFLVTGVRPCAK